MANEHILVVEDEEDILELLRYNLTKEGFRVTGVTSGEEALRSAKVLLPDLVLLDLDASGHGRPGDLPPSQAGQPGCSISRWSWSRPRGRKRTLSRGWSWARTTILPSPSAPGCSWPGCGRCSGAATGRCRVRATPSAFTAFSSTPAATRWSIDGGLADLTATEFRLLHLLARRPGWVFTRAQIVQGVHGDDYPVSDRSVDVQVVGLRKKLGQAGQFVETVRGVGYRIKE